MKHGTRGRRFVDAAVGSHGFARAFGGHWGSGAVLIGEEGYDEANGQLLGLRLHGL